MSVNISDLFRDYQRTQGEDAVVSDGVYRVKNVRAFALSGRPTIVIKHRILDGPTGVGQIATTFLSASPKAGYTFAIYLRGCDSPREHAHCRCHGWEIDPRGRSLAEIAGLLVGRVATVEFETREWDGQISNTIRLHSIVLGAPA